MHSILSLLVGTLLVVTTSLQATQVPQDDTGGFWRFSCACRPAHFSLYPARRAAAEALRSIRYSWQNWSWRGVRQGFMSVREAHVPQDVRVARAITEFNTVLAAHVDHANPEIGAITVILSAEEVRYRSPHGV